MKTKELADWLGVAPSTIRTWASSEFRRYLSDAAQGGDGRTRVFVDIDARLLAFIATLKKEGVSSDEIHAALTQLQSEDWADLPPMPSAPPGSGPIPMIPRETAETAVSTQRSALMREIVILQERVERLDQQLAEEREKREALQEKHIQERNSLQNELTEAREHLGELRGKLGAFETERKPSSWWLRVVLAVAVVVFIFTLVATLLAGGGVG